MSSMRWKQAGAALFRPHEPRGLWVYGMCIVFVVFDGVGAMIGSLEEGSWPWWWIGLGLAAALVILSVQAYRPTVFGWLIVLAAFGTFTAALSYAEAQDLMFMDWRSEIWPLSAAAYLITICIGLVLHRPKGELVTD